MHIPYLRLEPIAFQILTWRHLLLHRLRPLLRLHLPHHRRRRLLLRRLLPERSLRHSRRQGWLLRRLCLSEGSQYKTDQRFLGTLILFFVVRPFQHPKSRDVSSI